MEALFRAHKTLGEEGFEERVVRVGVPITQGSVVAAGIPDQDWGLRVELLGSLQELELGFAHHLAVDYAEAGFASNVALVAFRRRVVKSGIDILIQCAILSWNGNVHVRKLANIEQV